MQIVVLLLLPVSLVWAQRVQELEPFFGLPGESVSLIGEGFASAETYVVRFPAATGTVTAAATFVDFNRLSVVIPQTATSGVLQLELGSGIVIDNSLQLEVTRNVAVSIDPLLEPLLPESLQPGTFYNDGVPQGSFWSVQVSTSEATVVFANSGSRSSPLLAGVILPSETALTLTGLTTAEALLHMVPGMGSGDPERALAIRQKVLSENPTTLATIIANETLAGRQPFANTAFEEEMGDLVEAVGEAILDDINDTGSGALSLAAPSNALLIPTGDPQEKVFDDFVDGEFSVAEGFPLDLLGPGLTAIERIRTNKTVPIVRDEQGKPVVEIALEDAPEAASLWPGFSIRGTPLDTLIEAYELNPAQFDNLDEVRNLSPSLTKVYQRSTADPISQALYEANAVAYAAGFIPLNIAKNREILLSLFGVVPDDVFGFEARNTLRLPADRPGLYILRYFTGAHFPLEDGLVASLPGGKEKDARLYRLNLTLAGVEAVEGIAKLYAARGGPGILADAVDSLGAMASEMARQQALDTTNSTDILDIFLKGVKRFVENKFNELFFRSATADLPLPEKAFVEGRTGNSLKVVASAGGAILNMFDFIDKAPQVMLRLVGATNLVSYLRSDVYLAKKMQTSIVAVGDPFGPIIKRVFPLEGKRGQIIGIEGSNFTDDDTRMLIRFGDPGTSPDDPSSGFPASAFADSGNELIVCQVPTTIPASGAIQNLPVYVTITQRGTTSTLTLPPGQQYFRLIPDPEILSIEPANPLAGEIVRVTGRFFSDKPYANEVRLNGISVSGTLLAAPNSSDGTSLYFRAPNTLDPYTVTVVSNNRESNGVAITNSQLPATGNPAGPGAAMTVTTTADNTTADGELSLREAMLIARGGLLALGRQITQRPEDAPPGATYESDYISPYFGSIGPGPTASDAIVDNFTSGAQATPTSALPLVSSYDTIRVEINGGNLSEPVLVLRDIEKATIRCEIDDFNGRGILLDGTTRECTIEGAFASSDRGTIYLQVTGDAKKNTIEFIEVTGATETAVKIDGNARINSFRSLSLTGNPGDGLSLLESAASNDFRFITADNNNGNGVRLSGPGVYGNTFESLKARNNGLWGVLIDGSADINDIYRPYLFANQQGGIRITGSTTFGNTVRGLVGGNFLDAGIRGNLGPGALIESPGTVLNGLEIYGQKDRADEDGNGIVISGAEAFNVLVHSCWIGFTEDNNSGSPSLHTTEPNQGSGIVVRNGAYAVDLGVGPFRNPFVPVDSLSQGEREAARMLIANNADDGIRIEGPGTHDVFVGFTDVGRTFFGRSGLFDNFTGRSEGAIALGNGGHGIVVSGGARDVLIGEGSVGLDVQIVKHTSGAGILIEGTGTEDVRVYGTRIGSGFFGELDEGNQIGIHIRDGARNNRIGGPTTLDSSSNQFYDRTNTLLGNSLAGIVLESGGTIDGTIPPSGLPENPPTNANVIINNHIGVDPYDPTARIGNEVGVLLRTGAHANRIGGIEGQDGNLIRFNRRAGIEIDGFGLSARYQSNRILGNLITNNGDGETDPTDPYDDATAKGVGILLSNNASGHIIGGLQRRTLNSIRSNKVGLLLDGNVSSPGQPNQVLGTQLSSNTFAGIAIRNRSGDIIGPFNSITQNGDLSLPQSQGGIYLLNGGSHQVFGNAISLASTQFPRVVSGNRPNGITIENSSQNRIGGAGWYRSNFLSANARYGLLVSGVNAHGNQVFNNYFGTTLFDPDPTRWTAPNGTAGIAVLNDAFDTQIGGFDAFQFRPGLFATVDAPNVIVGSGINGVLIRGANSDFNRITRNRISSHSDRGIITDNGGNDNLPVPVITSASSSLVTGTVPTAQYPDGSIIELFSDGNEEGLHYEGSGSVTNGAFAITPLGTRGPVYNATATVVTAGIARQTSAFSFKMVNSELGGITLERTNQTLPTTFLVPANQKAVLLPFTATASGFDARLSFLRFAISGTSGSLAVTRYWLFLDADGNGVLSSGDVAIADPIEGTSNQSFIFWNLDWPLNEGDPTAFLLLADLNGNGSVGDTIEAQLENETRATFLGHPTPFPVTEIASYPISGDTIQLEPSADSIDPGFAAYQTSTFPGITDATIIGPFVDWDGDGLDTYTEFLIGTNASDYDASLLVQEISAVGFVDLIFRVRNAINPVAISYELSRNLSAWDQRNDLVIDLSLDRTEGNFNIYRLRIDLSRLDNPEVLFQRVRFIIDPQ